MKYICLFVLCLSILRIASAQESKQEFTLYGWVNANLLTDSRQSSSAIDNLYTLFPLPEKLDPNGKDLNAEGCVQLSTIITRIGGTFQVQDVMKGTLGARIEVDFSGGSVTNSLRFRHAYITWARKNTQLLLGRTWHPIFVERSFPITQNIGIGSPFQPFNRSPQLRWTQKIDKYFTFQGTALYQTQYKNLGPMGSTPQYQRDAEIPTLHAKLFFESKNILLGGGYDFKTIKPKRSTIGASGEEYVANEILASHSMYGFMKLHGESFHIKTRYMLGENNTELLQPGGFAVMTRKPETGAETYTNSLHSTAYTDFQYGKKLRFGLFLGYMKNHGFQDNLYLNEEGEASTFCRAGNVDKAYRISPRIEKQVKNFSIGLEYENNTAFYGKIDLNDKGKVKDSEGITNHRFMCSVYYYFNKKL